MGKQETLETIWEVPDELWERIEPIILEEDPPKARGRKRSDPREMLNGIIFRLRSGCQWNRLPKELGDDSTIHRTFQRWVGTGVLHRMWGALVEGCEELDGVDWEWQAADGAMGQGTFWGDLIGPNPTDRGKAGTKRSLLVDGEGGPLSIVVAGANVHDAPSCWRRPWTPLWSNDHSPPRRNPNTCVWTKGMTILQAVGLPPDTAIGSTSDASARRSWDASGDKRYPARRWVVERTLAWLSKCRAVLVRYDKKAANYLGVLQLACALLWFRRQWRLAILR